jgi:hypothetical protein
MPTRGTDVLKASNHLRRYAYDLRLVKALGIQRLRYSIPGNYIYAQGPQPDWAQIDPLMAMLQDLGLQPIADFVHHTSAPVSILGEEFFASPNLPTWLEEYVLAVLERYGDLIQAVTVFNEPYLTTQFCGEYGIWYPFRNTTQHFVAMLIKVATAVVRTSRAIRQHFPHVQLVHVDTCEAHAPAAEGSQPAVAWAKLMNQRRFLADDLIAGKVDEMHPLFHYLRRHGAAEQDLQWLVEHGVRPDVRGFDYYQQSEWCWQAPRQGGWRTDRLGFAAVAAQYVAHLGDLPVMLSETNFFGSPQERLHWHQQMVTQYCLLKEQDVDLRGYCWYPFINSVDFQHMLLENKGDSDPVGIYDLDEARWERRPTAFTRALATQLGGEVIEPEPEQTQGQHVTHARFERGEHPRHRRHRRPAAEPVPANNG